MSIDRKEGDDITRADLPVPFWRLSLVQVPRAVRGTAAIIDHLLLLLGLGLFIASDFEGKGWVLLLLILGPLLTLVVRQRLFRLSMPLIPIKDGDLMLIEDRAEELLCEVTIQQNGVVTRIDRGALLMESGRLIFNGRESGFALAAQDVGIAGRRFIEQLVDSPGIDLSLNVPGQDARLTFWAIESDYHPVQEQQRLDRLVKTFLAANVQINAQRVMPELVAPAPTRSSPRMLFGTVLRQFPIVAAYIAIQAAAVSCCVAWIVVIVLVTTKRWPDPAD